MDTILSISNLNLCFISERNREDSLYLFNNLAIDIPQGKITALVGGNGAGKTTLFNVISGLQKGVTGRVVFKGKTITGLAPYKIARLGIGRLFQGVRVFDELSILDNMMIGAIHTSNEKPFFNIIFLQKNKQIEKSQLERVENIFNELFGPNNCFWNDRYKPAGSLSYGQQRLLAIARLLMGNYSLYLLDEPTAGIHVNFIEQIASAIYHMNRQCNKTVLLIEHNMQFVKQIAENCLFMESGRIIAKGNPQEVLDNEEVQQIYMGF